jgi:hypothetical protein
LGNGRFDIGGVGVGHRLHHDRSAAADGDIADLDLRGSMPGAGAGDVDFGEFFGLVHDRTEYQVLMTFTNEACRRIAGWMGLIVSIVNSIT